MMLVNMETVKLHTKFPGIKINFLITLILNILTLYYWFPEIIQYYFYTNKCELPEFK